MTQIFGVDLQATISLAKTIVTQPSQFYEALEKHGGYTDPLKFATVVGVACGLIATVLSLLGLSHMGGLSFGLLSIVMVPLLTVVGCFVVGTIMFGIWKLMGSREDFESSFSSVAYSTAIMPITIIISVIPYIGTFVADVWWFWLMYVASIHVHRIAPKLSAIVLCIIAVLFMAMNLSGERVQRQNEARQGEFNELMSDIQKKTTQQPDG